MHLSAKAEPCSLLFSILIGAYYKEKYLEILSDILFECYLFRVHITSLGKEPGIKTDNWKH